MSVLGRKKETLYGNKSVIEIILNSPAPGCVVNGTY